jgi:hypothetical protein
MRARNETSRAHCKNVRFPFYLQIPLFAGKLMKIRPVSFLLLALVLLVLLPACANTTAAPTATLTLTPPPTLTETPKPSATSAPTFTSIPSATITSTPLPPTATTVPTQTATPKPTFAGFRVDYSEYMSYGLLFSFTIPGNKVNYRLDVSGVPYICNYKPEQVDKLFCYGREFERGTNVKLTFLPLTGSDTPVFQTQYKVTTYTAPTPLPNRNVQGPTDSCPVRGINTQCETEYRTLGNSYCIVATCFDNCGYYYSVNTCPPDMTLQGVYTFPGTPPFPGTPKPPAPDQGK